MDIMLPVFSVLCLGIAVFFAADWNRMKRQRDEWRAEARKYCSDAGFWHERVLDERDELRGRPARDPRTGRYVKR